MLYGAVQEEMNLSWSSYSATVSSDGMTGRRGGRGNTDFLYHFFFLKKSVLIPNNLYSVQSIPSVQARASVYSRFLKLEDV